jgi:uncharacterized protein with HEPN domain
MPPEHSQAHAGDRFRIGHMLAAAPDALTVAGSLDADGLRPDMIRRRALVNCLQEIGEAAGRLSPGGRTLVGDQPWRQIVGMRNVVVHLYWGIDLAEIIKTVRIDLPLFIPALEKALHQLPPDPSSP